LERENNLSIHKQKWLSLAVTVLALSVPAAFPAGSEKTPASSALQVAAKAAPQPKPKRGGILTVGAERDISTLNPFQQTFSVNEYVRDVMYDSLLSVDPRDNVQPNLAERWETSTDGKLYTFKLRRGVRFHNGQEMTSDDVAWTINYLKNPKNAAFGRQRILMVNRAEPADRYTLRVYLNQPHGGFLAALTQIKAGIVVPKDSLEETPRNVDRFPAGTGPFKFVEWQPNQRIVFERYGEYWGEHKALVDRLVFKPILDDTVRLTAVRAGDLDMMRGTPYEWAKQIKEGKVTGIVGLDAPFALIKRIDFNVVGSPFENKTLRHAIAHAIDREEIVQGTFSGFADSKEVQNYPRHHKWYIEGVPTDPFDLEKARALLKKAGYKGEKIELLLTPGSEDQKTAVVVQNQLRKIGLNLELNILQQAAREQIVRKGQFHFALRGNNFYPDISDSYVQDLKCEERRVSNQTGYCDKEMDELFDRADSEPDVAKRKALYKQILTKASEAMPIVGLVFVRKPFALQDYVKGFVVDREGRFRSSVGGMNTTWLDK
jgi:ABC-type transport system substrate-binding protein